NSWCRESCRSLQARGGSRLGCPPIRSSARHGRNAEPRRADQRAHRRETHPAERSWWFPDCEAVPGRAHFRTAQKERTNASSTFRRVRVPTLEVHRDISLTLLWSSLYSRASLIRHPYTVGARGRGRIVDRHQCVQVRRHVAEDRFYLLHSLLGLFDIVHQTVQPLAHLLRIAHSHRLIAHQHQHILYRRALRIDDFAVLGNLIELLQTLGENLNAFLVDFLDFRRIAAQSLLQGGDLALDAILLGALHVLLLLGCSRQEPGIATQQALQPRVDLLQKDLRGRRKLREVASDGAAHLSGMDIPALHLSRQAREHLAQLLLVLLLFLGEFPGFHQPLKAPVLWNDGEIHQFQPARQDNRQKAATHQCKCTRTHHGDPVVLQMERLFYKADFVLRRGSTDLIVFWHALEISGSHLDTHPHLSVAGSFAQTAENVVRQLVKLIPLFQAQIAGAVEG